MRVAFLTLEFISETPCTLGIGNYVNRVSAALAKLGHEVEVFTRAERDGEIMHGDVLVHRFRADIPSGLGGYLPPRFRMPGTLAMLSFALHAHRAVVRRHKAAPFDVVQAPQFYAPGLLLALLGPVPVITRLSNYGPVWRAADNIPLTLDRRLFERLERFALRRSAAVYAPSRCLAELVRRDTGLDVAVLRPPMYLETGERDCSVYAANLADRRYLLFVGTLNRRKGVRVLADALRRVLPQCPDLHFAFAGLAFSDTVRKLLPASNRIHLLGELPHSQLYPIIEHARGVVLPSLVDNLPNACLEAMAFARPVIGTRGASFDELLVDGESGFLVDAGGAAELAEAMLRLWGLPDERLDEMGRAARAALRRLSPEAACAELERLMAGIAATDRRRAPTGRRRRWWSTVRKALS